MTTVLIADDEANLRKVLCALLARDGHETMAVCDGAEAIEAISRAPVDAIITDLKMPRMGGLELLDELQSRNIDIPVIVITAHGTEDTAISALRKGAVDYIRKPFDQEELRLAVRKALAIRAHQAPQGDSRNGHSPNAPAIVGRSQVIQDIYGVIDKVAPTPTTVLITGESGTGKELIASAVHGGSNCSDGPFVKVNCAAIPKDLIESEFFGHERGAFTGAVNSKPGRFELADGGTLFLDEIAEIPIDMQVKLLRALQEGEFERVGGVKTMKVHVRVIAATNRDLAQEIERGTFREDLFYRLNVVPIALPALRERAADIPLLAAAFVNKCNARLGKDSRGLSDEALKVMMSYGWPGNIRELENVIERTLLFAEGDFIEVTDLPPEIRTTVTQPIPNEVPAPALSTTLEAGSASMKDIVRQATVEIEKDLIVKALHETEGNITRAAHLLGISRKGLQNKMKDFGLREPEDKR